MSGSEESATIREAEIARCRAISSGDRAGLAALLADDLTHTHLNGVTQDKQRYLAALATHPRVTTLGELHVRVVGDVAVMTGSIFNAVGKPPGAAGTTEVHALRVWHRTDSWRLFAFAASGPIRRAERQQ